MFGDAEIDAIYEDVLGRAEMAALNTTNLALKKIHEESQTRVPKGDPEQHAARVARAAGAPYPMEPQVERSELVLASVENPTGMVVYEGPYAAALEVGRMEYESKGGKEVVWEPEHYTTEGTGPHYLEDSLKLVLGQIPEEVAVQGRIAFGELSGPVMAKSTFRAAGHRQEMVHPPTGELAQEMRQEQQRVDLAAETSFVKPSAPPMR